MSDVTLDALQVAESGETCSEMSVNVSYEGCI